MLGFVVFNLFSVQLGFAERQNKIAEPWSLRRGTAHVHVSLFFKLLIGATDLTELCRLKWLQMTINLISSVFPNAKYRRKLP
jgi:hypothetical protein